MSDYPNIISATYTASKPEIDADGFTKTLYFYQRGPNDPPGNTWIWMCVECDQVKPSTHAPDCPRLRDAK